MDQDGAGQASPSGDTLASLFAASLYSPTFREDCASALFLVLSFPPVLAPCL